MWRKNLATTDTVFALASGSLPTAIAVEKLVGPDAFKIAQKIFSPVGSTLGKERGMHFGILRGVSGEKIDEILLLSFVGPHSFSGDDTIEFHCHGSVSVVQKLEAALLELGARPAERGEFTYRAHLNQKMSTDEIEDLADVFAARQPADLEAIYARREGSIGRHVSELRDSLLHLQAILDTAVDFSDEYSSVVEHVSRPLEQVIHECSLISQRYDSFRSPSAVPRIVLAGKPNAGKSSLFNALLCRYRAIVHDEPGTTRDVVEEDIQLEGRTLKLVDTAGLREAENLAEREGVSLGQSYLKGASLWLLVVDGTVGFTKEEENLIEKFGAQSPYLVVWNKKDSPEWKEAQGFGLSPADVVNVSAANGDGLNDLWNRVKAKMPEMGVISSVLPTSVQNQRIKSVRERLEALRGQAQSGVPAEYLSETNRQCIRMLENVVGEVGTEEILGRIFSEFCIGK